MTLHNPEIYTEQSIDDQRERIIAFTELLMRDVPVTSWMPEIHLDVDEPIALGLHHALGAKSGLILDTKIAQTVLTEADSVVTPASFTPRRTRAGHNSAHGVFFGDIELSNSEKIAVAVKPHAVEDNEKSAFVDVLTNYIVEKLGFYTLQPAGLLLSDGNRQYDTAYSLTILDEVLTTFDSINWSHFANDLAINPGMRELWRSAANQTAVLHDSGQASHGDLAARNIASSGDGGAFLIDWEKARFVGRTPLDAESRYQFSYPDIKALLESMARSPNDKFKPGIGLLHAGVPDWWSVFKDVFLQDYLTTRTELADVGAHNRQRREDIKAELEVLEADLRVDVEMFRELAES